MIVKDSGDRRKFDTGAVRDMAEGKGRCDLLPACALIRLSKLYEAGAKKYDERNWENGIPISIMIDSGLRHLLNYLDGQTDEDHLTAAAWNILGAMWMEEKHPELQDLPGRQYKELDKKISSTTETKNIQYGVFPHCAVNKDECNPACPDFDECHPVCGEGCKNGC